MIADDAHDAVSQRLSELSRLAPNVDRAERVRSECRTRLERRGRRTAPAVISSGRAWRLLTPVVVGGVCLLYALVLAVTTLRLEGIL